MLNSRNRLIGVVAAISLLIAAADSWAEAEVSGVRGRALAIDASGAERALNVGDKIANGDRLVTAEGAALGVLSGEYYTGLDQATELVFKAGADGRPDITLRKGHTRVINAGEGKAARIATPGLLAAQASSDSEAFVFPEKAWIVSMVCAYDAPAGAAQVGGPGVVNVQSGDCAVGKPPEGIYTAPASHERLDVLDGVEPNMQIALNDRFTALPTVALGLAPIPGFDPNLPGGLNPLEVRVACDVGPCTNPGPTRMPVPITPPTPPPGGPPLLPPLPVP